MALTEGDLLSEFRSLIGVRATTVDPIGTFVAGAVMKLGTALNAPHDFLEPAGIEVPVPFVTGALAHHARVYFGHDPKLPIPLRDAAGKLDLATPFAADMSVNWTIGEHSGKEGCSLYWDPDSPWYNTFYGAYGVRSHKADGLPWGFDDAAGTQPNVAEMLRVPEFDYNYLTAGQLGCPPEKQCFRVTTQTLGALADGWFRLDVECRIPSGLHRPLVGPTAPKAPALDRAFADLVPVLGQDVVDRLTERATLMYGAYLLIMRLPAADYVARLTDDYPPVRMAGSLYFKRMTPKITLAWGALCPATAEGAALASRILDVMAPHYHVAPR